MSSNNKSAERRFSEHMRELAKRRCVPSFSTPGHKPDPAAEAINSLIRGKRPNEVEIPAEKLLDGQDGPDNAA